MANNEIELPNPNTFSKKADQVVREIGEEEGRDAKINAIRKVKALVDEMRDKKNVTPSEMVKLGIILGECPHHNGKRLEQCIPELGQCGTASDFLDEERFPGGYKVWTKNDKYPVGLCTTKAGPTVQTSTAVPIAGNTATDTFKDEVERHIQLTKLIQSENEKIENLLMFFQHITNCEALQEESSCLRPKMKDFGVEGAEGEAPRCVWRKNDGCKPSVAYEREIGHVAEKKLKEYNGALKSLEAKLRNNPYNFTARTRRPVPLKGDDYSRKLAAAYDDWKNMTTNKEILESQIYAMEDARVKAMTKLHITQDQYIKYRALMKHCAEALDSNRTWKSCATESNGVCQILATGKGNKGGIFNTTDTTNAKNVIDNKNAYCVPVVGANHGLYLHDPNDGKVYFFDNMGNIDSYADPLRSWWDLKNFKLKNDKTGLSSDAFMNTGYLASIARFAGRLMGKNGREMDDPVVDVAALEANKNLAARARLLQRNMQMFYESLIPYFTTTDLTTLAKFLSQKFKVGWYEDNGEVAVQKREKNGNNLYTKEMLEAHINMDNKPKAESKDKFLKRLCANFNKYSDMMHLYRDTLEEIGNSDSSISTRIAGTEIANKDFAKEIQAGREVDIALAKAKAVLTYIAVNCYSLGEQAKYYWFLDSESISRNGARWRSLWGRENTPALVTITDTRPERRKLWSDTGKAGNWYALFLDARAAGIQHFGKVQSKFPPRTERMIKVTVGTGSDSKEVEVDIFFLRKEYHAAMINDLDLSDEEKKSPLLKQQLGRRSAEESIEFLLTDRVVQINEKRNADKTVDMENVEMVAKIDPNMKWENFHLKAYGEAFEGIQPVWPKSVTDYFNPFGKTDADATKNNPFSTMDEKVLAQNIPFLTKALELLEEQGMATSRESKIDWSRVPSTVISEAISEAGNRRIDEVKKERFFDRMGKGYKSNVIRAAEESFEAESLSGGANISLMSTEGGNVSLMSTETHLSGGANISLMSTEGGEVSLMSTESGRLSGGASLMSTEGGNVSLMSTEGGNVSLMSTEGGNVSLMSTESGRLSGGASFMSTESAMREPLSVGSVSLLSTEIPRSELQGGSSYNVESILSGGESDASSVSSSDADVDAIYAQFHDGSSVSRID